MNGFSDPFIRRPVGTILLSIGLLLIGLFAWRQLPVASLPTVDLPTIMVIAARPGVEPADMAATVAAPIERRLGEIAGVSEITSSNALGFTSIIVQFDLTRKVDGAARDVQAALNAAASDLPADMPMLPVFRKLNPSAAPVLILTLTSDTLPASALYDFADTVLVQRLSQVDGVGDVSVNGAEQPAIRVRADPARLAAAGLTLADLRTAIVGANAIGAMGALENDARAMTLSVNGQLFDPALYRDLVVRMRPEGAVLLGDVATVQRGVRNTRSAAWRDGKPAVMVIVTRQANANVIEVVDRIQAQLPQLRAAMPAGIDMSVLADRTLTVRASVAEMQLTLVVTLALVMLVVFAFLRRAVPTIAAGVSIPLSLAGSAVAMWAAGFSIDNISLMALAVAIGFVVDDAIVMIENIMRNIEAGATPLQAARKGARQIGFTVLSISLSLAAAFIPLLLMGGVVGRFFREFSVTLVFAIAVSTVVSLTVTPMICAHFLKQQPRREGPPSWGARLNAGAARLYRRSLLASLRHPVWMILLLLASVGMTAVLFVKTPKGFLPQDDSGLVIAMTQASNDISFPAMSALQQRAAAIVRADPAVAGVGSSLGVGGATTVNQGRMFIALKPLAERDGLSTQAVIDRMRRKLQIPGVNTFLVAASDLRMGGRSSRSQYQFTLWSPDLDELLAYAPIVLEKMRTIPGLVDVSTDREPSGLQANVVIDRLAAARLGVSVASIDDALNDAYAQRQISTLYGPRNQYRIILEVEQGARDDPNDIERLHVRASDGRPVRLTSVARLQMGAAPLVINHQGQFPAVTISYNLAPGMTLDEAARAIAQAVAEVHPPPSLRAEPAGEAKSFASAGGNQGLLILAALVAVYIVLGVLYESLIHPLTILSTLPPAGFGALLALNWSGMELSLIALIGIILLIGIVKKNGVMLVDFALDAERNRGLPPARAIAEACVERFRPIMMTTLAALFGAVPLIVATGPGADLRRPLGVAIAGGLVVSQLLTLYTTPAVYLAFDRLSRWARRKGLDSPPADRVADAANALEGGAKP